MRQRRKFSEEFKREAVGLFLSSSGQQLPYPR